MRESPSTGVPPSRPQSTSPRGSGATPDCGRRLGPALAGETAGTFLLVFFGLGAVHVAVLAGALSGPWQVAAVWGGAVTLAIYAVADLSGAHLNPAMTLAFAVLRGFPARRVAPYWAAQFAGAFLAAAALYGLFGPWIARHEAAAGLVRGGPGSERSAMLYAEYFPNPGCAALAGDAVGRLAAAAAEGGGTAGLAFVVFAVTAPRRRGGPPHGLEPWFIGLGLTILIAVLAPLTQAGFNPARDLAPRCFAWLAGWGSVAIPGPRGGFLDVYVVAPMIGALAGGAAFRWLSGSPIGGRSPRAAGEESTP